jgi:hypothetical protein
MLGKPCKQHYCAFIPPLPLEICLRLAMEKCAHFGQHWFAAQARKTAHIALLNLYCDLLWRSAPISGSTGSMPKLGKPGAQHY